MTTTQLSTKSLLETLIEHETGLSNHNDPENFIIARDYALNKLKTHKLGRTNQFDVISRLEGLEEKFRIRNNEDLADALEMRISKLKTLTDISSADSFIPEILHLLLELSDKPLTKSRLSDLKELQPSPPPRALTWDDIIADDPLEGEIWDDVDFGAESSDAWSENEVEYLPIRERLKAKKEPEIPENKRKRKPDAEGEHEKEFNYRVAGVEAFMVDGDRKGLQSLKETQYWACKVDAIDSEVDVALSGAAGLEDIWVISELQGLREVIFMILGHPCALFELGRGDDKEMVWVDTEKVGKRFALRHTSLQGFAALLGWFAEKGTSLNRIRAFVHQKEELPERQSFIAAVHEKIMALDQELLTIEEKFVGHGSPQPVSLLALQSQLEPLVRPFGSLCGIISNLNTCSHLEQLHQAACALQSMGDIPAYNFIASIFFLCLRTYLRPIHLWMESGLLPPTSDFLVAQAQSDDEAELGSFWHSQFLLRRSPSGGLNAPSFVHPVADRILTTGKSVVFLKRLLPLTSSEFSDVPNAVSNTEILFEDVCFPGTELAPFSSLFLAAFNRWISARHHSISSRLRQQLFTNCGLWQSLDALELIFFARNGYLFESLAQSIFEKIDRKAATWHDRFLLTEQIQSVFTGVPNVDPHRLRMAVRRDASLNANPSDPVNTKDPSASRKTVTALENVCVDYRLPWPIQNIINAPMSLPIYRRIFTLLLQLRRCRYLLERLILIQPYARAVINTHTDIRPYHALKHRLLWFANTVLAYITDLVLRPQYAALRHALRNDLVTADVDAMVAVHKDFVCRVADMCLLGPKLAPIHAAILQVLNIAVKFSSIHALFYNLIVPPPSPTDDDMFSPIRRPHHRRRDIDSDSDDEKDDEDVGPPSPSSAGRSFTTGADEDLEEEDVEKKRLRRYGRRVATMTEEVIGLISFVKEGLRGVARAGIMPHLDMLAEGLEGYASGGKE